MGGKNPVIITENADIDKAVDGDGKSSIWLFGPKMQCMFPSICA